MSLRKGHFCALAMSILLLCQSEATGRTPVGKADSLYQAALTQVAAAPVAERIEAFEQVLKADREFAPAHCELARLYLRLGTPEDRQRAERAIKEAIRLDSENVDYQLLYGDVLWGRGLWSDAVRQYQSTSEAHPESAVAAYKVGYHALMEFLKYKDMSHLDVIHHGGGGSRDYAHVLLGTFWEGRSRQGSCIPEPEHRGRSCLPGCPLPVGALLPGERPAHRLDPHCEGTAGAESR